ncbi:MAG: response regulator [Ignavibacteriaceae bacterium]
MENVAKIKKKKLLIVEDDLENQKLLEVLLNKEFEVEVCDSEQTFYEQLKSNKFEIILIDISIRGRKDGLELTKELKHTSGYENVTVVCLTGHAYRKDKENALKAGVDVFLIKPINNDVLVNTLLEVGHMEKRIVL